MNRGSNGRRTKRRRVIPARPKLVMPEPTPRIFENIRVYIHPNNINGSRRKVLHNLIQKYKGIYTLVPDGETTHVLVDEGISSGRLCRSLGWTTFPPSINVLMVSWLSASVRAGRCLNSLDYEIPCTHRPTFATGHHCIASRSTALTGSPDDCAFSEASSSSVCSEDADAEMPHFEYVYEDGSTYDDGKYDDTTCDDEWLLNDHPTLPLHTIGIVNPFNTNPGGIFPSSSFSSTSNFRSLAPASQAKKPKLENISSLPRPNTLAARLSRVRVRRIPEHLRVPGGSSVIVDLNQETIPLASGNNLEEETNQDSVNTVLNGIQTSSTDEKCKKVRMNSKLHATNKTGTEACYQNQSTESSTEVSEGRGISFVNAFSTNEQFDIESANEVSQVITMMVESVTEVAVNEEIINESVMEMSENESNDMVDESLVNLSTCSKLISDVIFKVVEDETKTDPDSKIQILDVESLNEKYTEISAAFNLEETAKILKDESMIENEVTSLEGDSEVDIELSKREPIKISQEDRSIELVEVQSMDDESLKNESVCSELISDVLFKVSEDEAKKEPDSKMHILNVQSLNENCTEISKAFNLEEMANILKDTSMIENEVTPLEGGSQMDIEFSKMEPMKNLQVNGSMELVEVQSIASEVPLPESPLSAITDASPYPIRLFRSTSFNSSSLECLSDDQTAREPVECITAEIGHPSNLESLESEVAMNPNRSTPINETSNSEVINRPRSCARPNISGPDIFFPFPISSSAPSTSSQNSLNINNTESSSYSLNACHGPNYEIIKKLQVLYESFKNTGDKWRIDVYGKAIISLLKLTKPIESFEDASSINGMSRRIAQKIWMISETGHLMEIDEVCSRQSEETRKLYSKAWGISARMARKLYKEGFTNFNDLWTSSNLSRSHFVGLRYYDDLKTKMTKKEATRIFLTVLKSIFEKYSDVQCDACASLRRNKNLCSYVSILVTLPRGCNNNDHKVLPDIVARLHQLGYLIDDLIRHEENGNQTKYVGIFKLGASCKFRRIDITVCTREEYACAILFLTGSAYFNRAIQQWASRREMVLDEHSLRIRVLNTEGGTDAVTKLRTPDERTIFSFLGLPYRTPEQRDRFIM